MVSSFQRELEKLPLAKADFCHEIKEIVDAIEYLEDDIAQAQLARDAALPQQGIGVGPEILSQVKADLRAAKSAALEVLEKGGCPAYKESY